MGSQALATRSGPALPAMQQGEGREAVAETLVEETDGKQLTKVISVMHFEESKLGVCSRDQIRKIF